MAGEETKRFPFGIAKRRTGPDSREVRVWEPRVTREFRVPRHSVSAFMFHIDGLIDNLLLDRGERRLSEGLP